MASNVAVRKEIESQRWFICLCVISAVADLFVDKKAAKEERKQMLLACKESVIQAFSQALDAVAGSLAVGLNAVLQYVTHFLQATGFQVGPPVNAVTPEGIIFVVQWVFLLLICYGVIALAFALLTLFLRWLWWLLKVGVAVACFGLILSDDSVDTKTTVFRLMCFGCVCILLSIKPWKDGTVAARIIHLEEQVKILENRVREMDRWRRRCLILSGCLIGILCFVAFIVYTIISNFKKL